MRRILEYAVARGIEAAFSALPEETAGRLGAALGRLAHRPLGVRRAVAEEQIAAAFPGRDPEWVRETARACYEHFGREASAIARLRRLDLERLAARTAGGEEALAVFRRHVPPGRGAVIVTGHVGNWELAGAYLALSGIPLWAVVKRQGNRRFDHRLAALRGSVGVVPLYLGDVAREVPRLLHGGTSVALVADQDARGRGHFVTFLGREASTFRGPARLALAHGAPLLFGALVREGAGYRAVLEPIDPPRPGPEAEREATARWVERLERQVRLHPEQYFWLHRRWKTRPPAAARAGGRERAAEQRTNGVEGA